MAERMLLSAIRGQPKSLNLSNKNIDKLSPIIGKITSVATLVLKGNNLKELPEEIILLDQSAVIKLESKLTAMGKLSMERLEAAIMSSGHYEVKNVSTFGYVSAISVFGRLSLTAICYLENINLGNNNISEVPLVLEHVHSLKSLHLFNNEIAELSPCVLCGLNNLTLLNLNNNKLKTLPREINRLACLEFLSVDNNELTELPIEICHLSQLTELHAANNSLTSLPEAVAFLRNLTKLYLYKNMIEALPEGLSRCKKLKVLDVSANNIKAFPAELSGLSLKELYCEENNLLKHLPVQSVQEEEALSLKEICARSILNYLKDSSSYVRLMIRYHPNIQEMLSSAGSCVVCGGPFLSTWLECVRFVDSRKVLGTKNNAGIIPLRGFICTYQCFNKEGHDYYGVARMETA